MAEFTRLCVIFLAVFVCGQKSPCSALRIEISPNRIKPVMPNAVNISCIPDDSLHSEAQHIMTMDILGLDGKPIASLIRGSDTPQVVGNSSGIKVEGHMADGVSGSYLTVTLLNPREEDAGLYQCTVNFLDDSHRLKEKTANANLTYDKHDVKSVMDYWKEKISELDKTIEDQTRNITNMETELMNKISTLEKAKENNISAFSAKYTISGQDAADQTIVFNEIITKEGEGYDEKTGLFTAPRTGIYGFHVVLMTGTRDKFMDLYLKVNGKAMAGLGLGSEIHKDQSSTSVLLKLRQDDVVNVAVRKKSDKSTKLQIGDYSVFTGYLLWETR